MRKPKTLAQKILAIRREAALLEKGGENTEDRYRYVRVGDILDVIEPLMQKHKLVLWPVDEQVEMVRTETAKGSIMDLQMQWTLEDVVTGESRRFWVPGSGYGKDEKGCQKAITASRKSAHVLIFGLRTAEAEEPEHEHDYPVDREEAVERAQEIGKAKIKALETKLGHS